MVKLVIFSDITCTVQQKKLREPAINIFLFKKLQNKRLILLKEFEQ